MLNEALETRIAAFRKDHPWSVDLNDREIAEILLALNYVLYFGHGTSGHLSYTVIEKLFSLLANG